MKALEPLFLLKSQLISTTETDLPKIQSMEHLQMCANLLPALVFAIDLKKRKLIFQNKRMEEFTSIQTNYAVKSGGAYWTKVLHPDASTFLDELTYFFQEHPRETYNAFFRLKLKKQKWGWIYGAFSLLPGEGQDVSHYLIAIGLDVSQLTLPHQSLDLYLEEMNFFKDNCRKFEALTPREKEVLKLINEQRTNQEIAVELSISKQTVQTHRKNVIKKLEVSNSIGLAHYGRFFEDKD